MNTLLYKRDKIYSLCLLWSRLDEQSFLILEVKETFPQENIVINVSLYFSCLEVHFM